MLALGLNDIEIGITASIYMFSQMLCAFLSGALIDKLGRRWSTAVFDFIAWSIPCLIWAFAEGFWFFVAAALLNGVMKVTTVSWDCLMIEDADKEQITKIYSWIVICGNLSALFAPIASILVARLTLVPAVRILYINAFVMMTAKVIALYIFSRETRAGVVRMKETQNQSIRSLLSGYGGIIRQIFRSPDMRFSVIISVLIEIVMMITGTFWQIIASKRINVPDALLPMFPMVKSILSIILFFTILARMNQNKLKHPLAIGFASYAIGMIILINLPGGLTGQVILFASMLFEAFGSSILYTLRESIVAINVDPKERSRILAILQMIVMLISVPFGYIGGLLSSVSRTLPFALNIFLLFTGILVTFYYFAKKEARLMPRQ
jgi:MFS family permease